MCLNTGLIPLLVNRDKDEWFVEGGLVDTIFWILLANALISPVVYIISPLHQLRRFRRWKMVREYDKCGSVQCSQAEANFLFEGPPVDLADRNAHLVKTYIVTMFYAPLLPLVILIGVLAFIIDYWVSKYMLLRIHARPKMHGVELYDNLVVWIPRGILLHAV